MNAWLSVQCATIKTLADTLSRSDDLSESRWASVFDAVTKSNDAYFEVYLGFPDGTAFTGSGYEFDYSWWHANERGWYKLALTDTSKAHITAPYTDTQTGELCITAVHAVVRSGELLGVVSADIFVTDLQNMVLSTISDKKDYVILLGENGDIIVHPDAALGPDKDDNYQNLASINNEAYKDLWGQVSASDKTVRFDANYYTINTLDTTGWRLMNVLPAKAVSQPITTVILTVIPLTLVILALAALLIFLTIRKIISKPVAALVATANDLSSGDVGIKVGTTYQGEMKTLAEAFRQIADSTDEQSRIIDRLAHGDLTVDARPRSNRDAVNLSLAMMTDGLNTMLSEIHTSINHVSKSSKQVADGSQSVAQSSSEQSSVVVKLIDSVKGISSNTKMNAEIAGQASMLADTIKENAEKGSRQMDEMMLAVKGINDAGQSISKVIKVIDDIAFQTNILALNAAVEAARAGTHGKGFAVVAEEVRNLASKSAAAAKDTGALITNSIEKAELGARIADATAMSLTEIVTGINESSRLVGEMTRLSRNQEADIKSLNQGLDYVAQGIQSNSASAVESAAASEEMSSQAVVLGELVSQFKLKNGASALQLPGRR